MTPPRPRASGAARDEAEGVGARERRLGQLAKIPVEELRGVGPKRGDALRSLGLSSVLDLLTHYPRRYIDRTRSAEIGSLVVGEQAFVTGTISGVSTRRLGGRRSLTTANLDDGTGRLRLSFFNQAWRSRQLVAGMDAIVFGKVGEYRGQLQMSGPLVDLLGTQTGRVVPVYPQSEKAGVTTNELARDITEALERAGDFADPLPNHYLDRFGLVSRTTAFRGIHMPEEMGETERAKRRLAFDELLRLQLLLVMRKRAALIDTRGIEHDARAALANGGLVQAFLARLPFALTGAQSRAIDEIASDLESSYPMHRLLQGDVGSGKTIVALASLLVAVQGGHQGALMVPTEVLADQHYLASARLLAGLQVPDEGRLTGMRDLHVALLTSRTSGAERTRIVEGLGRGEIDIVVGTHALLTEDVSFRSLGVVVIDEQHRFGVDQRAALRAKGSQEEGNVRDPDLLVMTATPIPRTAAMTVYGDLDMSILDELPAGRQSIETIWIAETSAEGKVWERVREEVAKGNRAYIVCALVHPGSDGSPGENDGAVDDDDEIADSLFDEDELVVDEPRMPPRSAVEEFERLTSGELADCRIGLLHGQLRPREKEETMAAFRDGELDVLVATTVIEVGVDVPSATVMVIEDADRFGIAQLHQLRGRVGRGSDASVCYLLAEDVGEHAGKRVEALVSSGDGFELAEVDLDLRGEGTLLGARQKGRNDLKLASLRRDRDLVGLAREVATEVIASDPVLIEHRLLGDELRVFIDDEEEEYLFRS